MKPTEKQNTYLDTNIRDKNLQKSSRKSVTKDENPGYEFNSVSDSSLKEAFFKDTLTPKITAGSGKIPDSKRHFELQILIVSNLVKCAWAFFSCKKDSKTCEMEHQDCVSGNTCEYHKILTS